MEAPGNGLLMKTDLMFQHNTVLTHNNTKTLKMISSPFCALLRVCLRLLLFI